MSDKVDRDGRFVTVSVGGVRATREYCDPWHARRAENVLKRSEPARLNFFRRPRLRGGR